MCNYEKDKYIFNEKMGMRRPCWNKWIHRNFYQHTQYMHSKVGFILEYWKRKGRLENIINRFFKHYALGNFRIFYWITNIYSLQKEEEIFLKKTIFQRTIRRKYPTNRTAGQHINQNDNKPQNKAIFYPKPFGMC